MSEDALVTMADTERRRADAAKQEAVHCAIESPTDEQLHIAFVTLVRSVSAYVDMWNGLATNERPSAIAHNQAHIELVERMETIRSMTLDRAVVDAITIGLKPT